MRAAKTFAGHTRSGLEEQKPESGHHSEGQGDADHEDITHGWPPFRLTCFLCRRRHLSVFNVWHPILRLWQVARPLGRNQTT